MTCNGKAGLVEPKRMPGRCVLDQAGALVAEPRLGVIMRMVVGVAVAVVSAVGPAVRADVPVDLVGQWGGVSFAVTTESTRVYLGVGPRLVVLDVSQPSAPAVLGQSPVLPGLVLGVAVSGSYAYVADRDAGLQIIDISNPASPVRVGGG